MRRCAENSFAQCLPPPSAEVDASLRGRGQHLAEGVAHHLGRSANDLHPRQFLLCCGGDALRAFYLPV